MGIVIGPVSQIMTRYLVWVDCMHAPKLLADNDQQLQFWENTVNSLNVRQLNAISWGTEVDYRAKTQNFCTKRYTAGFSYTDSQSSA